MKKTFRYIIGSALATSALLLTGCSLDEDNPHAGDATLNNFAAWSGMQETTYFPLVENLFSRSDYFMMAETGTDMWVCAGNGDNTKQAIYYEELSPDTNAAKQLWKQGYQTISTCNTIINEAGNLTDGDQGTIDILVAETKTLRAFYYSLLVTYFGPITLNTESSSAITGIVELNPTRASEKDIYDFIINDLIEAEKVLPVTPYQNNRARVSKKTAKALLARVYAQRAGLGDKFYDDGEKYWDLARQTAEEMIDNPSTYGVQLYNDIADMWAESNNRDNKEALFLIAGADPYNQAYSYESGRFNNLSVYAGGGFIDNQEFYNSKFYNNYRPSRGQSYFYGRQNVNVLMPSEYLMYCFNPEWDRRWEYQWIYAQSDFSFLDWGGAATIPLENVVFTWNEASCAKFGVDPSHAGESIQPYANLDWVNNGAAANQYNVRIWPEGSTTESNASQLLRVANSSAEFGQAGVVNSTRALTVPYPVSATDNRIKVLFLHDKLSAAEEAARPYITFCIRDLYVDTYPYGATQSGSPANYLPKGDSQTFNGKQYPSLSKFNWTYDGCFTANMQRKTGDIYIMRMAEVYLLAAEANQKLGKGEQAAKHLNVLRKRALRPGYTGTYELTNATEDDVLDEYAREMCGEFIRWSVLKRHNNIAERLARYNKRAAKTFKPYMYNRPISQEFLRVILNADEYGDNGYGTTAKTGVLEGEQYQ